MARIAGIDLPRDKKVEYALTYIFGIGLASAQQIVEEARVDPVTRVRDLTESEISELRKVIEGNYTVEGELRREVAMSIRRLMEIGCYRGIRHRRGRTDRVPKSREKKNVVYGVAHIKSTFNNTIVSITDTNGAVLSWASAGTVGFKGTKKSTPFAAQLASENAARKAMEHGLRRVDVYVRGPGSGRETAIRSLQAAGLEVVLIKDVTPIPHNGCRAPKRRRV